jgi:elongation factor 1-alpha
MDDTDKQHVSIVICGHVDAGKSTTTGRLIYELGGISERDMEKLRTKATEMGKGSFAFAFYMDTQKEEQERGVTISCTTKEFFTDNYHYTIIDAPGHRDFIKNMITGSSQADVALLMVPSNSGGFETSIAKGGKGSNEVQGQTRQHARLINLIGVEQLIVGINKMDDTSVNYSEDRFNEIKKEVQGMLTKVGWKKDMIQKKVAFLPISGWEGDNLLKKSEKMKWWNGVDVETIAGDTVHINTLLDVLNNVISVPKRQSDKPFRMPISGVLNIKGVGDVLTGRVEQGEVVPGSEVVFLPTHTESNTCAGKVFKIEMHHKEVKTAGSGDNVGINMKGLAKTNMPRIGDIMVLKKDTSLKSAKTFRAQIAVLDHPGQLKIGYTPVAFIRTSRSAVRMTQIHWKLGKSTGGQKLENPPFLETGDMAEVEFVPSQPFVAEPFNICQGLARVAIMEGRGVVMLGKVIAVNN